MNILRNAPLLLIPLVLLGCTVASTIQTTDNSQSGFYGAVYGGDKYPINPEIPGRVKYRIFHQASTGFVSVETIRESAQKRAISFCSQTGTSPYLIEETMSRPPHILGNWPRIEIIFSCVKNSKASDATVTTSGKYDRLSKLKTLLDNGTITQREFEDEKAKILSE